METRKANTQKDKNLVSQKEQGENADLYKPVQNKMQLINSLKFVYYQKRNLKTIPN